MLDDATPPAQATSVRRAAFLGPRAIAALIAGLVVLVAVVGASVYLAERTRETLLVTARTDQARIAINDVLLAASDGETGQRGFLLTGRDIYLVPYNRAAAAIDADLAALHAALSADPETADIVGRLDAALRAKFTELKATLDIAQAGQHDAAIARVLTDEGRRDMAVIRTLTRELQDIEQHRVQRQLQLVNSGGQLLVVVDIVGLALILVLGGGVIVGMSRTLETVRRAETELTRANARLERARDTLEERVRLRTAELTEANVEIQRFAYIVSHDLRAPLVNILGFTSELESATNRVAAYITATGEVAPQQVPADVQDAAREDLPEAIGFIRTSAQKMDRLIGAILKLSREGGRVMTPEPVAMRPLLEGITATLQHQATASASNITIEAVPDVVADRLMVEQIFSNLLENALKYLKPGRAGDIRVRGHAMGTTALFEVTDNGRGIAARDHERIFELFRRAGDQTVAGEGIGLAHVRALVRRLGGKIDCESTVDVGSTFRIQLPLRTGAAKGVPG